MRYYDSLIALGGGPNAVVEVGPFKILGGSKLLRQTVSDELQKVINTPRGKEMMKEAARTARQERIILAKKAGSNGDPRFGVAIINTGPGPFVSTTKGLQRVPMTALLAHELGHVLFSTFDDGPGSMNNVRQNENPVRKSLGLPLRTKYGENLADDGKPRF